MKTTVAALAPSILLISAAAVCASPRSVSAAPVAGVASEPPRPSRLPVFGLGADVGLPDGANLSLVARPWSWLRAQASIGSNSISHGWRAGVALLPFGTGPAVVAEYGRYQEGNANALASKLLGSRPSPLLERVGYDYVNLHLGLSFGYRRVVFFVQGGPSFVRGQIHNLDQVVRGSTAGTGSTEVAVHEEPSIKATAVSGKLGLIVYIW